MRAQNLYIKNEFQTIILYSFVTDFTLTYNTPPYIAGLINIFFTKENIQNCKSRFKSNKTFWECLLGQLKIL